MVLLYSAVILAGIWVFQSVSHTDRSIPYSRFRDLIARDRIVDVKLGSSKITGHFKRGDDVVEFETNQLPNEDRELVTDLRTHNVKIESQPDNPTVGILLTYVLPFGLIILVWFWMFRRMGGPA